MAAIPYESESESESETITGHARLPPEAYNPGKRCANCWTRDCTLFCEKCREDSVGHFCAWYCTMECQRAHLPDHEVICRSHRKLSAAVGLLSEIWTMIEERTYIQPFEFDKMEQGVVQIKDRERDHRAFTGKSLFWSFPQDVMPAGTSPDIQRAILFKGGHREVATIGDPLVQLFLSRLTDITVRDIFVEVKDPAMVVTTGNEPMQLCHAVLGITLPTSEEFIIDLAGAQFGFREVLYPESVYDQYRLGKRIPSDFSRAPTPELMRRMTPEHVPTVSGNIRKRLVRKTKAAIQDYFSRARMSILDFLLLDRGIASELYRQNLIDTIKFKLDEDLSKLYRIGIGRLFYGSDMYLLACESQAKASVCQTIWLSEEEYESLKDDQTGLEEL